MRSPYKQYPERFRKNGFVVIATYPKGCGSLAKDEASFVPDELFQAVTAPGC